MLVLLEPKHKKISADVQIARDILQNIENSHEDKICVLKTILVIGSIAVSILIEPVLFLMLLIWICTWYGIYTVVS